MVFQEYAVSSRFVIVRDSIYGLLISHFSVVIVSVWFASDESK